MAILKGLIRRKTAMTYEYHGQLYWNTVLEKVTNQYQKVVQNNDVKCGTAPEIVILEMTALVYVIDLINMRKTFSIAELNKLVQGMLAAIEECLGLSDVDSLLKTIQLYNDMTIEAHNRNINPIMHSASVLRHRCDFYGPDYIETNILARSIILCCTKWDSIKKDFSFTSESQAQAPKYRTERVYGIANSPVITSEGLLLQLFGPKTTSQQIQLMIEEFDKWSKTGEDIEILNRTFMRITSGGLTEADINFTITLFFQERNMGFKKMMTMFGAGLIGTDSNEIPEGIGIFGFEPSNPIPTKGIAGSKEYLNNLRTSSGHKLTWERWGSLQPKNIADPVDGYIVVDETTGEELRMIFLCPYHKRNSAKAPDGFYLELGKLG